MGLWSKAKAAKEKYDTYAAKAHTAKIKRLKARADRLKAAAARRKAVERQEKRIAKYSKPKRRPKARGSYRRRTIWD